MASLTVMRYLIDCDGCKSIFGDNRGFHSLTEARAAAYSAGWQFPAMVNGTGLQSARTSDVCSECAPNWQPEQTGKTGQRQRILSRAETERLP